MRLLRSVLILLFFVPLATFAGSEDSSGKEPSVSSWTSQRLSSVNSLLANEEYDKAREKLSSLIKSLKGDKYEIGLANQAMAYSYALQENYPRAIVFFEKAVPGLAASPNQTQKTRFDLGQLYMAEAQYDKAILLLEAWLKNADKKSAQAHILLGNAYAQLEKTEPAIPHVIAAIEINQANGKEPKEPWYQLLLSLHLDNNDYKTSVKLLPKMIEFFPKRTTYWKQLGAVHLHLKDFKSGAAALEIAWQNGLLTTETEIVRLAYILLHIETPEKAARLLASSLAINAIENNEKHWRLLGDAWLLSRETEKAVAALVRAASYSDAGNLNERAARILVDQGQWDKAITQLSKALEKGSLKHPGNSYLLLGIASLELEQTEQAKQAFNQAIKFEKTKKSATQWLKFIDQKA